MNKRGILGILLVFLLLVSPVFAHRRDILDHDSYDVYLGGIRQDSYVHAGDYHWMMINFENNIEGKPDLKVSVYIPELGIFERKMVRNAKEGKYSEPVLLPVYGDAEPGEYLMKIVISTDGYKKVKYRPIQII